MLRLVCAGLVAIACGAMVGCTNEPGGLERRDVGTMCDGECGTVVDAAIDARNRVDVLTTRADGAWCVATGGACTRGGECCSLDCTVFGECAAPAAYPCATDSDCPSTMLCQTCDHACVFPPNGTCDLTAACPCGYYCSAAICKVSAGRTPAQCAYDADCPVNYFCNRAAYVCQIPMHIATDSAIPCTRNADCIAGDICSDAQQSMQCVSVDATICRTSLDCGSGFMCSEYQCIPGGC